MKKHMGRGVLLAASSAALVATLVVAQASPALADTSQATARAALLQLNGGSILDTGLVTATNDGTMASPGVVTGNTTPALSLLGTQTTLTAGVLVQQAVANPDGTSAACAGVVGNGGIVQIGVTGACTATSLPSGGVTLSLPGLVGITADAILAQCTASSSGAVTGSATLINAHVTLLGAPLLDLPLSPTIDQGIIIPGITSVVLNDQFTPAGPGSIGVTALDVNVLNLVHLALGTVTCGPNAAAPPIPAIPLKGAPFAAATVAAAGLVALGVRRRRAAARVAS